MKVDREKRRAEKANQALSVSQSRLRELETTAGQLAAELMTLSMVTERHRNDGNNRRARGRRNDQCSTPAPTVAEGECVICMDAKADVVSASCGHLVVCIQCTRRLLEPTQWVTLRARRGLPLSGTSVFKCPACTNAAEYLTYVRL